MDLISQDSYEKRHKQSTIPTALVKENEIKQEPLQKKQRRNNKNKNTNFGKSTQKNKNCGFCGQQNWLPSRQEQVPQNGTFRKNMTQ